MSEDKYSSPRMLGFELKAKTDEKKKINKGSILVAMSN